MSDVSRTLPREADPLELDYRLLGGTVAVVILMLVFLLTRRRRRASALLSHP